MFAGARVNQVRAASVHRLASLSDRTERSRSEHRLAPFSPREKGWG
jgi:hypothetical protein